MSPATAGGFTSADALGGGQVQRVAWLELRVHHPLAAIDRVADHEAGLPVEARGGEECLPVEPGRARLSAGAIPAIAPLPARWMPLAA